MRLTGSGSRQVKNTPMTIRVAKALMSQTKTGTFFNLSMKTSCYNRGRRSPGANACHYFMNRYVRLNHTQTPASLPRADEGCRWSYTVWPVPVKRGFRSACRHRERESRCHPRPWRPPRRGEHFAVSPPPWRHVLPDAASSGLGIARDWRPFARIADRLGAVPGVLPVARRGGSRIKDSMAE